MMQTKLKVSNSRKGLVGFIILIVAIEAPWVLISFNSNPGSVFHNSNSGLVFSNKIASVAFFVICFSAILTSLLVKVEVIDSTISVRTRIGRSFSFTISEITKIVCNMYYDSEDRQVGMIIIEIANRKFKIEQTMDGFKEMTGYILEKLESGEINEAAVSEQCKRKLSKYKNDPKILK